MRRHPRQARVCVLVVALLVAAALAEGILALCGLPHEYRPHTSPPQFAFLRRLHDGYPVYRNLPSADIRFEYDGNPRGYFGPANEVDHLTNRLGFRGPEFQEGTENGPPAHHPGVVRFAFLGDSFTFGEGVRFEDTYPEQTAALLRQQVGQGGPQFEAYNFGVGGYNTCQELLSLQEVGWATSPDIVVVGYVLNDAEPPLFEYNPATGGGRRRERLAEEAGASPKAPDSWLFRLRSARLVWRFFAERATSRRTIEFYRALYKDSGPGWRASRNCLREIAAECSKRKVACCIVLFPILYELGERYPFTEIHAKVRAAVEGTGALFVDLLPELKYMKAEELWVHPTDHHPNERVHRIAAAAICRKLGEAGLLQPIVEHARHEKPVPTRGPQR